MAHPENPTELSLLPQNPTPPRWPKLRDLQENHGDVLQWRKFQLRPTESGGRILGKNATFKDPSSIHLGTIPPCRRRRPAKEELTPGEYFPKLKNLQMFQEPIHVVPVKMAATLPPPPPPPPSSFLSSCQEASSSSCSSTASLSTGNGIRTCRHPEDREIDDLIDSIRLPERNVAQVADDARNNIVADVQAHDDNGDDDDDDNHDLAFAVLPDAVYCANCHTHIASRDDFIMDLFLLQDLFFPWPDRNPERKLLFHVAFNVDFGKVEYRCPFTLDGTEVHLSCLYCESCQTYVGLKVVEVLHGENELFRVGRCILKYMTNGEAVI